MRGWRASTWGDEISLEYGKALRAYEGSTGKYRVFGSNGPIGWTSQPLAPGPGVILGCKGAYRGVQYSHEPFFVIILPADIRHVVPTVSRTKAPESARPGRADTCPAFSGGPSS